MKMGQKKKTHFPEVPKKKKTWVGGLKVGRSGGVQQTNNFFILGAIP